MASYIETSAGVTKQYIQGIHLVPGHYIYISNGLSYQYYTNFHQTYYNINFSLVSDENVSPRFEKMGNGGGGQLLWFQSKPISSLKHVFFGCQK